MNQKRRNTCGSLDAQAQNRQIECQHFQKVDRCCSPIPTHVDVRLKSVAAQSNASLGVEPHQTTDDGIEFFAQPAENTGLLIPKRPKQRLSPFQAGSPSLGPNFRSSSWAPINSDNRSTSSTRRRAEYQAPSRASRAFSMAARLCADWSTRCLARASCCSVRVLSDRRVVSRLFSSSKFCFRSSQRWRQASRSGSLLDRPHFSAIARSIGTSQMGQIGLSASLFENEMPGSSP